MTLIVCLLVGLVLGYLAGRVHDASDKAEHQFQMWRDRITAAALMPRIETLALDPPTLELEASDIEVAEFERELFAETVH